MKIHQQDIPVVYPYRFKFLLLLLLLSGSIKFASAQCPPNIDFELGNFTNWQCWTGNVVVDNSGPMPVNKINLNLVAAPVAGRHTMNAAVPGNGLDSYGGFPIDCPNGSGYSVKIGNNLSGSQAEGVSYTFTIPAGQNQFNIIYHYAVVFQGPQHSDWQQPRLVIDVYDLTDNMKINCSSFEFFKSVNQTLPGFKLSANPQGPTEVWYKDWAATSIKLDGYAGKTIRVFFKTADCTLGGHFGYAYVDVNTQCSSLFTGAVFCPDDAFINVTAPYGYQTYEWWDAANPAVIIGTTQTINFTPPPAPGTILKVAITPYAGYGCVDTLTAVLIDTLTIQSQAGPDRTSCQNAPVQLGAIPTPNYIYSWSPVTGLSNPNISNPIATPSVTTQYVLTTTNGGGGCASTDTVMVFAAVINNSIQLIGPATFCPDGIQTAILEVQPADSIQWYLNNVAIPGANQTQYNVLQTGSYHATLFSFVGCSLSTAAMVITIHPLPTAGFNVNAVDQCFTNHQFVFTNTSSVSSGTLQYEWDLGDGNIAVTPDVNHSYVLPGPYIVRLIATTNNGCKDTIFNTVRVFDMPVAGFTINSLDQCFDGHQFVFTNTSSIAVGTLQYNWDLGDGNTAVTTNVTHSYAQAGTYTVRLIATSNMGCIDSISFTVAVFPEPVAGFNVNSVDQCFKDHQFVFTNTSSVSSGTMQYDWDLGDGNTAVTPDVNHSYTLPGTYIVRLIATSNNGCKDTIFNTVHVFDMPVAGFTVNTMSQCFKNNQFVFTNTSSIAVGTLQYNWNLGDGTTAVTTNVNHSYTQPGTYTVGLLVTSDRGCIDTISFTVTVFPTPVAGFTFNTAAQCYKDHQFIFTNTSTVFSGNMQYSWDMGNGHVITTTDVTYSYPLPGAYTVKLLATAGDGGCKDSSSFNVTVHPTPVAGFTVNSTSQCQNNNQFVFTNTSTVYSGPLQYNWNFGDGTTAATANVTHGYALPGTYIVKMLVTADGGCVDSSSISVIVHEYPVADFYAQPVSCINLPVYIINKTINRTTTTLDYLWEFGNGQTSSVRTPVYSYPATGNYTIKLTVNITNCPTPVTVRQIPVVIEAPVPGIAYPPFDAKFNFPEQLHARQIGTSVLWTPATSLDNRTSYTPTFKGVNNQLYLIALKTDIGCITVDTQLVKTLKKIEIYVPTVFTPNGNGVNDLLRPLLFGFDKVNYFRVYNRWGKLLFQMQSDRPGWDGRVNGQVAEMQTVVWMIEAVDVDGKTHRKQGTTVLIH